jgi:hypothetical protein
MMKVGIIWKREPLAGISLYKEGCMAERPEDLSLPASVVARIIKDAVLKINNSISLG